MAQPLLADVFVNAMRAEGVRVVTVDQWRTHNRNHKGAWGPIHGVMFHHTAGGESGAVQFCYDGSAGLRGPLCHGVIAKDGTVHVISTGRSNHAGGGDPNVLEAVKDERYGDYPPATHQHQGTAGAVDGNAHFYGFECVNLGNGKDPWPAVQVDAMIRVGAALTRAYGWTAKSVIAHKEWSDYKPDPSGPGMPTMAVFRAKIAERLAHPASWNPSAPTPAPTPTEQGPDMAPNTSILIRNEDTALPKDTPVRLYWTTEYADEGNEHGAGGKTVLDGGRYVATLNLRITGLGENETVKVYPVEEDGNGNWLGNGAPHELEGRGNPALPVQQNVTVVGRVGGRLSFELITGWENVVVTDAQLVMQSWAA